MTPNRSVVSGSRVPPTKSSKPHQGGDKQRAQDPNIANPRLLVNRPCIYERHLPGGAYITAHIQRLQHGYYSSKALSDTDYDHVDFFAVDFVFHCPNTQSHRFKSATIRASVHAPPRQIPSSPPHYPDDFPSGSPRFLMHAPHLIYGAVSPETLQWTFSLAGSLGVSEPPVSANFMPSGSMYGSYRHYEMMKIQGSSRTLRSRHSRALDIENGQVVWTLEENNLQKSGLPREFTFAVLIQKPGSDTKLGLTLDIDPVVQSWFGTYPRWWISQPRFLAVKTKVDFRHQIGQRFEPVSVSSRGRGFNFADLVSSFDAYVNMPGRKFSTSVCSPYVEF